jgi:hypothetical protein
MSCDRHAAAGNRESNHFELELRADVAGKAPAGQCIPQSRRRSRARAVGRPEPFDSDPTKLLDRSVQSFRRSVQQVHSSQYRVDRPVFRERLNKSQRVD